jgi:hypothetical protein
MNYDVDLGPVLITDNFHKTAFSQVQLEYLGTIPSSSQQNFTRANRQQAALQLQTAC